MAVVEVNAQNFPGSVLTGSGSDTLKLIGGGTFNFDHATVSGFSTLDITGATASISGQQLAGVTTVTGFGNINLTGSQIDLSDKTFTSVNHVSIADDNATVTVSSLSLGLDLDAVQKQGETIVLNGPVSTPASRSDLFAHGFDEIVEGQNQWIDAAPVITGLGGEHLHVRAGEAVLLDPDGNATFADAEGNIAFLNILLSDSGVSNPLNLFELGSHFSVIDESSSSRLLYQGTPVGNIGDLYNDRFTIAFNAAVTPDIVNEFVRTLAYAPGNFIYEDNITITFTARDVGSRKAQAVVYVNAEQNWTPTEPTLTGKTVAENAAAGTVVGILKATDANGDPVSYRLTDDAGGRFAIQGDKLVVSGHALIDYETAKSYAITVVANDGNRDGQPSTFTIGVTDVDDTPSTPTQVPPSSDLSLRGTSHNDRLTGLGGDDTLYGLAGTDVIKGGTGNDVLSGGAGKDVLTGGKGKDIFVFDTKPNTKTNLDKITDFNVKDDTIWLDNKVFAKLGKGSEVHPGKLNAQVFTVGDHAKDKNDYLIYDAKKGALWYDADGSGNGKAVEIATLKKGLKMTFHDLFVI